MFVGSIIAIIGTCVTVAGVVVQNSFKGIEESYGIALHNSGMIVMLIGGVGVFVALIQRRNMQAVRLSVREKDGRLWVWPLRSSEALVVPPFDNLLQRLKSVSRGDRLKLRAILAAEHEVTDEVLMYLVWFPSVALLDFQKCKIEPESVELLGDLQNLQYLFVAEAISAEKVKVLHSLLPEMVIYEEPTRLGFSDHPIAAPAVPNSSHPPIIEQTGDANS